MIQPFTASYPSIPLDNGLRSNNLSQCQQIIYAYIFISVTKNSPHKITVQIQIQISWTSWKLTSKSTKACLVDYEYHFINMYIYQLMLRRRRKKELNSNLISETITTSLDGGSRRRGTAHKRQNKTEKMKQTTAKARASSITSVVSLLTSSN